MPAQEQIRGQRQSGIDMAGERRHDHQDLRHLALPGAGDETIRDELGDVADAQSNQVIE
jgi:hypothetical protein